MNKITNEISEKIFLLKRYIYYLTGSNIEVFVKVNKDVKTDDFSNKCLCEFFNDLYPDVNFKSDEFVVVEKTDYFQKYEDWETVKSRSLKHNGIRLLEVSMSENGTLRQRQQIQ